MQALCEASDWVISAVTASNTLAVAQAAAPHLRAGMVFLDLNSASPGTKQQAAALVQATGAHYVEAGVMTSVPPYGIRVPMLLGGSQAASLAAASRAAFSSAICWRSSAKGSGFTGGAASRAVGNRLRRAPDRRAP